ncbi:MAG: alkaline phosphatase family protein [Thaumarchaeota archaeon]|nr:alkaline phosphatase family protein [Nitrososphaerota archaeon]
MKFGYVLLDGCGDRATAALNFTTPLQSAYTPNMDALARRSKMGRVITVGRGIAPESDIAVFNMLGYSFAEGYPGRGVVESVGAGLRFEDGDLALRANFATTKDRLIADRRAGRDLTKEETNGLDRALMEVKLKDAEVEFRSTVSYRAVMVIRDKSPLSAEISNTDPAYVRTRGFGAARAVKGPEKLIRCKPLVGTAKARRAAALVNDFLDQAAKILENADVNRERKREGKMPANLVLLRDAGDHLPRVPSFEEKHGVKGVALVEMPAEVGIARLLGMKEVRLDDHRDLARKAELFARELSEETLVYAHIKGPDEFGHDGDAPGKKKNIEAIDRVFFGGISEAVRGVRMGVSCDHSTPCELKMHSSDPVPLMISSDERDTASCRFTEQDAARGSLKTLRGHIVLDKLLAN